MFGHLFAPRRPVPEDAGLDRIKAAQVSLRLQQQFIASGHLEAAELLQIATMSADGPDTETPAALLADLVAMGQFSAAARDALRARYTTAEIAVAVLGDYARRSPIAAALALRETVDDRADRTAERIRTALAAFLATHRRCGHGRLAREPAARPYP